MKVGLRNVLFHSACNARASMHNIVDLCRPISNRFSGTPFKVHRIVPVDMFPGTLHYEVVYLLKR